MSDPVRQINLPHRQIHTSSSPERILWAVGGGKGGIGKTLLTSNMAVYLSWLKKRVIVVDMDLGGANLHTSLGVTPPKATLSDFVLGKVSDIKQIVQPTHIPNISLISGAQDAIGITNIRQLQKTKLSRTFKELDADIILMDLGAGTTFNTLDFFLLADKKIVVVTPEPTSIENGYRFIKAAFYRMLRTATPSPYVRQIIEQAMDQKNSKGLQSPKDLLDEVTRISPKEGEQLKRSMENFHISIILNQVRISAESEIGKSVELVCERYFGMRVDYVGFLPYENSVWQSVRRRRPFVIDCPNSSVVSQLEKILRNLLNYSTGMVP